MAGTSIDNEKDFIGSEQDRVDTELKTDVNKSKFFF
jgi:hypothetical protein